MEKESKRGAYTLQLPKNGDGPEMWTIQLREIDEDVYVAATGMFKREKDMQGMKFILQQLHVGGDDIKKVTDDWRAVYCSAEQIMSMLPQAQATLKKN